MHKLFAEFAQRYKDREGGYTRILQTRRRPNDNAQMAYIECAAAIHRLCDSSSHCCVRCHLLMSLHDPKLTHFDCYARYIDREGELRKPRPPRQSQSLMPAAAEAAAER